MVTFTSGVLVAQSADLGTEFPSWLGVLVAAEAKEDSCQAPFSNHLHHDRKGRQQKERELMALSHSERLGLHNHRSNSSHSDTNRGSDYFL